MASLPELTLHFDGERMKTYSGFFEEFARVMHFPDYFGKNFNALNECITDMEWLQASSYQLVFHNASSILAEDKYFHPIFIKTLEWAKKYWRQKEIPEGEKMWEHSEIDFDYLLLEE